MAASGLDLRAVEELLDACARQGVGTAMVPCGNLRALLVHVRALRAALEPFAAMYEPSDRDVERMADTCPVQWQYDMYGTQGLTLGDLKRAALVLGAAQDGETLGLGAPP